MVVAQHNFEPLKEFIYNVNSNDTRKNITINEKTSELSIEYFTGMIENDLADPLNLCESLRSLDLENLFSYELTCAWTAVIKRRLHCSGDYKSVQTWIQCVLDGLIARGLLSKSGDLQGQMNKFVLKYCAQIYGKELCCLISENSLDKIVSIVALFEDDPNLTVALHEIVWSNFSTCLERTVLFVTKSISEILIFVVQSIKALLQIDKSGAFLERCLKLVKTYLQAHRKESLGGEVLGLILRLSHASMPVKPRVYFDVPDIDQRNFDSVMFGNIRGSTKTGDVFCILANFLESSGELVLEYKRHLIKKMHSKSQTREALVKEMKAEFERMKKKFAGDEWRECEVLIHDFEASLGLKSGPMELLRISNIYWPDFEPKSFFLPCNQLQAMNTAIIERAAVKEQDKVYEMTNSFSRVDLDLEFTNRTVSVSCNADEASVLLLLSQLKSAYFGELQRMTGFSFDRLKEALCTWVRKGIALWQDHDRFNLVEEYHEQEDLIDCQPRSWRLHTEEESEQTSCQIASELSKLIPLICGVLSNLGPMPLGILHAHLQKVSLGYQSAEYDLYLLLESHVTAGVLYLTAEGFYHVTNKI